MPRLRFRCFMGDIRAHKGKKCFCRKCLGHFIDELRLKEHSKYCRETEGMQPVLQVEDDPKPLKFHKFPYQPRIPIVGSTDFECLLPVTDKRPAHESAAFEYHHNLPSSVGLMLVSTVPSCNSGPPIEASSSRRRIVTSVPSRSGTGQG